MKLKPTQNEVDKRKLSRKKKWALKVNKQKSPKKEIDALFERVSQPGKRTTSKHNIPTQTRNLTLIEVDKQNPPGRKKWALEKWTNKNH